MSGLRLRLLGGVSLALAKASSGAPIELAASCRPILSYLVVHRRHAVTRGELADALWPEREDGRARRCLSTALWRLKQSLGGIELIDAPPSAERIALRWTSRLWCDVVAFEHRLAPLVARAPASLDAAELFRLERALTLYRGDLAGDDDSEWTLLERERVRNLYLDALAVLTQALYDRAQWQRALVHGRELARLEPLREDVHRLLMRTHIALGNRAKALEQYRVCVRALASELGVAPMEPTQALYRALSNDAELPAAAPADAPAWRAHARPASPRTLIG
jgi:DNA-binding SARP family transcriptional activator